MDGRTDVRMYERVRRSGTRQPAMPVANRFEKQAVGSLEQSRIYSIALRLLKVIVVHLSPAPGAELLGPVVVVAAAAAVVVVRGVVVELTWHFHTNK